MGFVLTEEQQILRDSAKGFIAEKSPVTELRRLRDSNDENGFDTGLWSQMAEMGFAGIIIPEEYGGAGFGYRGLGLVLEEAGRTLAASPLVSTSLLCASALLIGGSEDQKKALLPEIASGNLVMALAMDEGAHHNPANIEASAAKDGDGYVLNGTKSFVLDGHVAGKLIVAARTSGARGNTSGLTLFIVDGDAAGVTRKRHIMVDSRNAAAVTLDGVQVDGADVGAVPDLQDGGHDVHRHGDVQLVGVVQRGVADVPQHVPEVHGGREQHEEAEDDLL